MAYTFYNAYIASLEAVSAARLNTELKGRTESLQITLSLDDACQGPAIIAQSLNIYAIATSSNKKTIGGAAFKVLEETLKYMRKKTTHAHDTLVDALKLRRTGMEEYKHLDLEEQTVYDCLCRLRLTRVIPKPKKVEKDKLVKPQHDKTRIYRDDSQSSASEISSDVQSVSSEDESSSHEPIPPHSP